MTSTKPKTDIDTLLQSGEWMKARHLLERERRNDPENHWVLTQLGVTYYEQGQYQDALELFLESRSIVPDCPLTLWNLAGSLDSLGHHAGAVRLYTWLLQSSKSLQDDPCWESKQWTDALKTDCVFRMGVCLQHMKKKKKAEHCYRQYLRLLSIGIEASYTIEDVKRQMQELRGTSSRSGVERDFQNAVDAALEIAGFESQKGRESLPPPDVKIPTVVTG